MILHFITLQPTPDSRDLDVNNIWYLCECFLRVRAKGNFIIDTFCFYCTFMGFRVVTYPLMSLKRWSCVNICFMRSH